MKLMKFMNDNKYYTYPLVILFLSNIAFIINLIHVYSFISQIIAIIEMMAINVMYIPIFKMIYKIWKNKEKIKEYEYDQ